MLKVLLTVFVAAVLTTFAMDNMHHVGLGLIVGTPVYVRLFFLLLTSFLLGCFSATLMHFCLKVRAGKREQSPHDAEDEAFFSE